MRIAVIGASGFIGRELARELVAGGHQVLALTRNVARAVKILGQEHEIDAWDGRSAKALATLIDGCDGIINLAGLNLSTGRWTVKRKKLLVESRIIPSESLCEAIRLSEKKPAFILQASAIGIYGTQVDSPAEEDHPPGTGFVAEMAQQWEESVMTAENNIVRVAIFRTGLVLGKGGGLLQKIILPFRFFSGAVLAPGNQWMSWIHIRDHVRAIRFLAENRSASGPYNLTAPNPVRMNAFMRILGKTIHRPVWMWVPGFVLKAVFGEMASETVMASQNIYPGKLTSEGFRFEFPQLEEALQNLLTRKKV